MVLVDPENSPKNERFSDLKRTDIDTLLSERILKLIFTGKINYWSFKRGVPKTGVFDTLTFFNQNCQKTS